MDQNERRRYLIDRLLKEENRYKEIPIPADADSQKRLLRSLMNIRMPKEIDKEFLNVQDEYLRQLREDRGITDLKDLSPIREGIYLWQGDITLLRCDAIVNAANAQMLGCFVPCHACIDNCIHTYAGIQLRYECSRIMEKQGHEEKTGTAKITKAYNLPCRYVIHTVGPIIEDLPTRKDEKLLSDCYRSCLELADANGLRSIAFCCISTGVFRFPNRRAAEIAVSTVNEYKKETKTSIEVIFNVYKDIDRQIYEELL
ncbi:MAG: protein-ADP-ribose hydrolase [Erysipelotrichaceae bacterium]|nr:protein-ADP-ribose hydrolase [Erysipelotrichaceae bacterium]